MKNNNRIFMCHAHEDQDKVLEVYQFLKSHGLKPWLDKIDLLPGQDWDKEIRNVLKNAEFVIVFFSANSIYKRGYVQREMKLTLDILEEIPEGKIFVIPVVFDDCEIPPSFSKFHYAKLQNFSNIKSLSDVIISTIELQINNKYTINIGNSKKVYDTYYDERDGRSYDIIDIKGKLWLGSNLHYRVSIDSFCYNNDENNFEKYGLLYTRQGAKVACPRHMRIPTKVDWDELIHEFGGPDNAYNALKEGGVSNLNMGLGGSRQNEGRNNFQGLGHFGYYHTSTPQGWFNSLYYGVLIRTHGCTFDPTTHIEGLSLRCIMK